MARCPHRHSVRLGSWVGSVDVVDAEADSR